MRIIWEFLKTTNSQAPPRHNKSEYLAHLDEEMCWQAKFLRRFERNQISNFKHNLSFKDLYLIVLPPPINTQNV